MNVDELINNPYVVGGVAGGILLVMIVVLLSKRGKGARGRVVDDTKGRARTKIRNDLRMFRDDVQRAVTTSAPVFKKIETESEFTDVVGHWRKEMKHKITVRSPDFNALKGIVRSVGYDAAVLIDLDSNWRRVGKQVSDYNTGKFDASKTPIIFAKEFARDLNTIVLMANMCLTKYGS